MKVTFIKISSLALACLLVAGTGHAQTALLGNLNNDLAPVRPDSIVQVAADSQGLQLVLPEQVPACGTFWWVVPGGAALPTPCPPPDLSGAIYQIADGQFLVDETGGQVVVNPRRLGLQAQAQVTSRIVASAAVSQADSLVNLITQVQTATEDPEIQTLSLAKGLGVPIPGDGSDDGTGTNSSDATGYTLPDYGTNLWIAQVAVAYGNLTGIGTNTQADIQYDILSRTNLLQTDWQTENSIFGSETTNWTPFSVAQNNRTNLFIRLRSDASSDGSGLPDWWELEYFGTTGVNPYGNPAGDGYSNLQKYQNGMNPNVFYTPPAPQGLTVQLNQTEQTASLSWLPSAGAVVSYTVEKSYQNVISDFTTTSTSYTDSLVGNIPDPWSGDAYQITYSVKANYSTSASSTTASYSGLSYHPNGLTLSSSYWTAKLPVQPTTVSGDIVPGPNGETYLEVAGVPPNATIIRLKMVFTYYTAYDTFSTNVIHDIPVTSFANGRIVLSANWLTSPVPVGNGVRGTYFEEATIRSVDANGTASAANNAGWLGTVWGTPFYDGRAQMKQNLIFQFRAAPVDTAFHFWIHQTNTANNYDYGTFGAPVGPFNSPTNYSYSGLYPFYSFAYTSDYSSLEPYLPFRANSLFRNFVYNPGDVDDNGNLTTGATNDFDYISLSRPPRYEFQTNGMALPNLLSANSTRWLFYDADDVWIGDNWMGNITGTGIINPDTDWSSYFDISMSSNVRNYFGLPYLSSLLVYQKYDDLGNPLGLTTNLLNSGATHSFSIDDFYSIADANYQNIYVETAQPQFRTVKYCFYRPDWNWLPGSDFFTPTNDSPTLIKSISGTTQNTFYATNDLPFLIVPVGLCTQIAGYAKLAVVNGYPGVYGYLGQYFDQTYKVDDNGNVTTNQTGVLSPYGYYFATDVGVAALVTLPDIDTGERGTCMVYSVSLQLDKNHDGTMDTSFNGPDVTSSSSPFLFWANNNYDRWATNSSYGGVYTDDEQDDQQIAFCPAYPSTPTSDCNYSNVLATGYAYRAIPCTRDLEDFARLWVCGITTNLLTLLPTNSTITLSWGDVGNPNSNNPTIDLFAAADPDGGIGYQTNETVATAQINPIQCPYIGRLAPGGSIQLNANQFASSWAGNHLIWCGVNYGSGGLTLTVTDGSGNTLAQTTSYIQIVDIKQMYERYTVGDNSSVAPLTTPVLASENLPVGVPSFEYPLPQNTNTPYILHVHGYNMPTWSKDRYAETEYKRLYWHGYQGRFGFFRWPTTVQTFSFSTILADAQAFDLSESNAWASATGLLNLLKTLDAEYPGQVYLTAHSHGNVVVGEALRQATQQGLGQVVNTYVAMQAAIDSHTYDATTSIRPLNPCYNTPDRYGQYYTNGAPCYFNGVSGAGTYVNFFNINDWALVNTWELDQNLKPDNGYAYSYNPDKWWAYGWTSSTTFTFPADTYTIFSYIDQGHGFALGMQPGVGGVFKVGGAYNQIELDVAPYNFGPQHIYHSGEFRSDNAQRWQFWYQTLHQMGLK